MKCRYSCIYLFLCTFDSCINGIESFPNIDFRSKSTGTSSSISYGYDDFQNQWADENLSSRRQERLAREKAIKNRFVTGKDLTKLRIDLNHLRDSLLWAKAVKDEDRVRELTKAIADGENCDADIVYHKALTAIETLKKSRSVEDKELKKDKWTKLAEDSRSCLPRFQLDGLWVGDFGQDGHQMINVTYSGDKLVATAVTDSAYIARGSLIFEADLSPQNNVTGKALPPIDLPHESAEKWGVDKLYRYPGKGNVAQERSSKPSFVESQFIMYENHFSVVWIPTRQHVLFGRPSPEVTLRMLRDIISKEDEMENMRNHLEECIDLDMTTSIARTLSNTKEPLCRISRVKDLRKIDEKHMDKQSHGLSDLFQGNIWKSYIDGSSESQTPGFMNLLKKNNWKGFFSGVLDNDEKKEGQS